LLHVIFFFICLSFSVGVVQSYVNDEDENRNQQALAANGSIYRLRFDRIISSAMDVLRMFCIMFCGPFILSECFISIFFYGRITGDCPEIEDALTNILIYVLIVLGCISLTVSGFCCYMMFLLARTVKEVWP
jgi:hypothetical protein